MATAGSTVVGVDWRVPLDEARRRVGPGIAVQGNLDPATVPDHLGGGRGRDPRGPASGRAPTRATSSTSATGSSPRPTRASSSRWSSLVHAEGRAGVEAARLTTGPGSRPDRRAGHGPRDAARPDGIESFYTSIRRGRPPTPELLAELVGRYEAIGGTSPLTERTRAQVDGLAAALEAADPGPVRGALRGQVRPADHRGGDGRRWSAAGVDRVVGIVLTPHQSSLGSGEYFRRAPRRPRPATPAPSALTAVPSWHRAPGSPELLADRTDDALGLAPTPTARRTAVFFTAHSLPLRVVAEGDPYPDQVGESASDIAGLLGLDDEARR